jgi:hypothetical protein
MKGVVGVRQTLAACFPEPALSLSASSRDKTRQGLANLLVLQLIHIDDVPVVLHGTTHTHTHTSRNIQRRKGARTHAHGRT